jgi:hypothetical protein
MDGMESMYLTVKNFIVMTANTFQIDFSHIFNILHDIKVKRIITVYLGITLYYADEFHTDMHKMYKGRSFILDKGLCMLLVEDDTIYSVHILGRSMFFLLFVSLVCTMTEIVTSLTPWRPRFSPRLFYMGFIVNNMAPG